MDNMINLEALDYRDQLIKDYIDEHTQQGGGGSSSGSLYCELEVTQDHSVEDGPRGRLYLKCNKGDILETDEIQFARKRATQTYRVWSDELDKYVNVKRHAGWIIPRNVNYIHFYKVLDTEKSNLDPLYDYWEILPKNKAGENSDWETFIDEFLRQRHDNIDPDMWYSNQSGEHPLKNSSYFYNYACIFGKWAGIAIKRNGILITGYKEFMLVGVNNQFRSANQTPSLQLRSTFTTNGRYIRYCGPKESDSGEEEKVYAFGFLLRK